jgi:peptide/nickel transport system permease protein
MGNQEKISYYIYLISRNKLFILGLLIVALLVFSAIFAPWITPYPGDATGDMNLLAKFNPPGSENFLGADIFGRDVFTRVVFGTRKSLLIGFGILLISASIGIPLGLVAGYYGGKIDEIIMRISDGFLAFPPLLLPIAIGGVLGSSMKVNMLAIALAWWPWYVRLLRAQVLTVREQLYVTAAKSIGVRDRVIILRHVLSNSMNPLIVQISLDMGYAILMSASLSFIGIGAKPPVAEWGLMINEGRAYFLKFWWTTTFPGIAIFITVFGFNLLGDGVREILDPKARLEN